MVEVEVLDAPGEVIVDDEPPLYVRNAADVEVTVQVQLVKLPVDSVLDLDTVHGQDNVTSLSRQTGVINLD